LNANQCGRSKVGEFEIWKAQLKFSNCESMQSF
jgi:hypothetical protein